MDVRVRADGFSNSSAAPDPSSTFGICDGSRFQHSAASSTDGELRRREVVDLQEVGHPACSARTLSRIATAASISSSVTSSDGSNRNAVGVTAFTHETGVEARGRDRARLDAGRELRRDQEPGAADVGDARERQQRLA